ncbi:MAG: hypothetical protein A2939_00770 [Parcubacteria group bacterium RIFCSPLOWO2_01_FULL_48_18]|nr:MAG: hypothetical protein A3J67_01570 [Parcubacteria group bacterium RIFCSPHIGHO2_02_FULL_48_10b]OHB22009.1 MAG: hypothetical protein A2939_00770 [Parcubacteria group bacterium RIFCSPLOWO2_01_FULL_48_18]
MNTSHAGIVLASLVLGGCVHRAPVPEAPHDAPVMFQVENNYVDYVKIYLVSPAGVKLGRIEKVSGGSSFKKEFHVSKFGADGFYLLLEAAPSNFTPGSTRFMTLGPIYVEPGSSILLKIAPNFRSTIPPAVYHLSRSR